MQHFFLTVLLIAIMAPCAYFSCYFLTKAFPMKHPQIYCLSATSMMFISWGINHCVLPAPSVFVEVLGSLFSLLMLFCMADPGRRFRTVLAQALLFQTVALVSFLSCTVAFYVLGLLGISGERLVNIYDPVSIQVSFICNSLGVPATYGVSRLLKYVLTPSEEPKNFKWFLAIPVSQMMFAVMMIRVLFQGNWVPGAALGLALATLISIVADVACVVGYRKYHHMQEIARLYRQAEHQLEIQTGYYRELQDSILAVNQIRHDLMNQLQSAYYLLEQGHPEEVRQQLDLLKGSIQKKVGSRYCENLMVDAVLTEKAALCKEKGIELEVSTLVPVSMSIENAHLCSAFSNILDNSIHGTLEAGGGKIELSSDIHGAYLVIRCSNPAVAVQGKKNTDPLREHGLGLGILQQLADRYQGYLQTQCRDGSFVLNLSLRLS